MCEILVYAKTHWMDAVPEGEREGWDEKKKRAFRRRLVKGNPVVVKPNGWKWGKEECPPTFVIVKVPNLSVETALQYLESAPHPVEIDEAGEPVILYRRKWCVAGTLVDAALLQPFVTINAVAFGSGITDRTQ